MTWRYRDVIFGHAQRGFFETKIESVIIHIVGIKVFSSLILSRCSGRRGMCIYHAHVKKLFCDVWDQPKKEFMKFKRWSQKLFNVLVDSIEIPMTKGRLKVS